MQKIIFITGGARSGKSTFALKEASKISGKKAFIATAVGAYGDTPLQDGEMKERIENHKSHRGKDWDIYEEPLKIADIIKKIVGEYSIIIIDCLTLWLSNLMHSNLNIEKEIEDLIGALIDLSLVTSHLSQMYIVSNEVGMGIVPDNKLARRFRDMAGLLNQKIAEVANEFYMVVAGIPIRVK
ncbi:MAG: bifunctional adenosylcobinamide kinase/adenosylcobinamide-phosphate guanylyltransferase [Nitrospirota bacterium]